MPDPSLDPQTAQALLEGRHGDPFSVLGPHRQGKALVVTAFVPGADRLWLLAGKAKPVEALPIGVGSGLFSAPLTKAGAYRLRAEGVS